MQHTSRRSRQSLARWLATVILLIVAAFFGQDQLPGRSTAPQRGPLPDTVSGAGRTVDGDSLFVGQHEVRLKGLDAPEGRQTCTRGGNSWACGEASRNELRRLIGKDVVMCRVAERDRHGRLLSNCTAGGRDLNAGMVASGFAVAYGGYVREEGDAKMRKRGLWSGQFQKPRDWRRDNGIGQ